MIFFSNNSDKLYKWSDNERSRQHLLTSKAQTITAALTLLRYSLTQRLSYRNLQALRKVGLQMYDWTRPWPKVLPVRQLSWSQTPNDLYSKVTEGQGSNLYRQSLRLKKNRGGYLRNQSGTDFTARPVLNVFCRTAAHHYQCQRVCRHCCQYGFRIPLNATHRGPLL